MSTGNMMVAGATGGKRVNVVPSVQAPYQLLEKAARDGNYWARMAVAGIRALTSGRMGKDNIYVRPGQIVTQNFEQFHVFLPGCTATCERRANDQYYLVDLVIDNAYAQVSSVVETTGLHKAEKINGTWNTTIYEKWKIGRREK